MTRFCSFPAHSIFRPWPSHTLMHDYLCLYISKSHLSIRNLFAKLCTIPKWQAHHFLLSSINVHFLDFLLCIFWMLSLDKDNVFIQKILRVLRRCKFCVKFVQIIWESCTIMSNYKKIHFLPKFFDQVRWLENATWRKTVLVIFQWDAHKERNCTLLINLCF